MSGLPFPSRFPGADALIESLPPLSRLALAYAPAPTRVPALALLALDARLAGIVRSVREPALAQLRLAWWRERFSEPQDSWPSGEPLLAALASWRGTHSVLGELVDGWEGLIDPPPLELAVFSQLADARGMAFGALAGLLEQDTHGATAVRLGCNWALADLAAGLSHPSEQSALAALIRDQDWTPASLPRALRPLAVLHGIAARSVRKDVSLRDMSVAGLGVALRLGLFGR